MMIGVLKGTMVRQVLENGVKHPSDTPAGAYLTVLVPPLPPPGLTTNQSRAHTHARTHARNGLSAVLCALIWCPLVLS